MKQNLWKTLRTILTCTLLTGLLLPVFALPAFAAGSWKPDGNWEETVVDGSQAFKKNSADMWALATLIYDGYVDFNTVEFDYKFNESSETDGNITLAVFLENGGQYSLEINAGQGRFVRFRRYEPETVLNLAYHVIPENNYEWHRVKFIYGENYLECLIDGVSLLKHNDTGTDRFDISMLRISSWGTMPEIKNIRTSKTDYSVQGPDYSVGNAWTQTVENGETVYTNTIQLNSLSRSPADNGKYNTFSADVRINSLTAQDDANVGLMIYTSANESYFFEYNPAPSRKYARLRRFDGSDANGTLLVYCPIEIAPFDQWVNLKAVFMEDYLLMYVNGRRVLSFFDTNGSSFSDAQACVSTWNTTVSVKNMQISNSEKDMIGAGYLDMEFSTSLGVQTFTASGGNLSWEKNALILYKTDAGAKLESPEIRVAPGNRYSMRLPLRNTFVVRMKNGTSSDRLTLSLRTDSSGEKWYSKEFKILPDSGDTTYYFNISDLGASGYLRQFSLLFEGSGTGEIKVDAITFEREEPIYDYAGEILSCVADRKAGTVTVEGKADPRYNGQTVTLWQSDPKNYNDSLNYPDLKKLAVTAVKDGRFSFTIPLYKEGGRQTHLSTYFLASIGNVKVSPYFVIENYQDFNDDKPRFTVGSELTVNVTSPEFGAKGDGFTDDTAAFQKAIDAIEKAGGGKLIVPGSDSSYGRRYILTHIELCSNLELVIEKGAVLWQSQREEELQKTVPVNMRGFDRVSYGHNVAVDGLVWCHAFATVNKPFIYAGQKENIRITGGGTIRMNDTGGEMEDPLYFEGNPELAVGQESRVQQRPIVFFMVEHADITDITILRANGWQITCMNCSDLYLGNITEKQEANVTADGFELIRSKNVTIDRCFTYTSDDAVVFNCEYSDGREQFLHPDISTKGMDNSVRNITVRHSYLFGGFGTVYITWGSEDPDLEREEISNIEIFDCTLGGHKSVGSWPDNPFYGYSALDSYTQTETDYSPVKDVFYHDNAYLQEFNLSINGITPAITNLIVTDKIHGTVYSPSQFQNPSFERDVHKGNGYSDETDWVSGLSYWSNRGTAGTVPVGQKQSHAVDTGEAITVTDYAGYIRENGELFQGLYKVPGEYIFRLRVKAEQKGAKLFVRDAVTKELIAQKDLEPGSSWREETLAFDLDRASTIQLGIMFDGEKESTVYIDDAGVVIDPDSDCYKIEGDRITENFDNGMGGFTTTNPGSVTVKDGTLRADSSAEHKIMFKGYGDLKDFEVSVDILSPANGGGLNTGLYVLAGNAAPGQDMITAYNIQLESAAGSNRFTVQIYRFDQAYLGSVASGGSHTLNGGRVTLRVLVKNGILYVFIDQEEEPCVSYVLPEDARGGVGLRSQFCNSEFDNFSLTVPKAENDPARPPATGSLTGNIAILAALALTGIGIVTGTTGRKRREKGGNG